MKPEFSHVQNILVSTISLLCKNSLSYHQRLRIQGLLGITIDDEVFLVEINEQFNQESTECIVENVKLGKDLHTREQLHNTNKTRWRSKRKKSVELIDSSEEDISEAKVENVSQLSSAAQDGNNIYPISGVSPGSEILHVKKENAADDVLLKFVTDSENISKEMSNVQTRQNPADDYLETSTFEPKAEDCSIEIISDDTNQNLGEASWEAISYANSFNSQSWLDPVQSHVTTQYFSNTKAVEKKGPIQKRSFTGEEKLVHESVPAQRWSLSWRRPVTSIQKQFICDIEGCTRSYYAKKNLLRHQTTVHGRVPMYRRPRIQSIFHQGAGH